MSSGSSNQLPKENVELSDEEFNNGAPTEVNPQKRPKFNRDSNTDYGPKYTLANAVWQAKLTAAANYEPPSTTEEGQRFTESQSKIVLAKHAQMGLPIMIPANTPNKNELLNGDWGATSNFVFALLQEKPTVQTVRVAIVGYLHSPATVELQAGQFLVYETPGRKRRRDREESSSLMLSGMSRRSSKFSTVHRIKIASLQ